MLRHVFHFFNNALFCWVIPNGLLGNAYFMFVSVGLLSALVYNVIVFWQPLLKLF